VNPSVSACKNLDSKIPRFLFIHKFLSHSVAKNALYRIIDHHTHSTYYWVAITIDRLFNIRIFAYTLSSYSIADFNIITLNFNSQLKIFRKQRNTSNYCQYTRQLNYEYHHLCYDLYHIVNVTRHLARHSLLK